MKKIILLGIFAFLYSLQSCNPPKSTNDMQENTEDINLQAPFYTHQLPPGHPRVTKVYDSTKIENYYPFIVYNDNNYMVAAEIESPELFMKYSPIFERNNYSGTGYSWEGVIQQVLEKERPELLKHIQFDLEAGGFYIFADNAVNQRIFAVYVSKFFKDTTILERYLKIADRSRIDD